jgi:primosomal protein N' (replication factor Y)
MKFADIAVPVPVYQTYTYVIPPDLAATIRPGYRVIVPLVKRKITGYVVSLKNECDRSDLKPIYDLLDDSPALSPDLLTLAKWIAEYYICPLGEVIKAMLPGGINLESNIVVKLLKDATAAQNYIEENHVPTQEKILSLLLENREMTIQLVRKKIRQSGLNFSITKLVENGFISREVILSTAQTKPKFENWLKLSPAYSENIKIDEIITKLSKSAPSQATCLEIVKEHKEISQRELLKIGKFSSQVITAIAAKGYIEKFQKEVFRSYYSTSTTSIPPKFVLNEYQKRAIVHIEQAIQKGEFKTFLIHGVTGSGKTQVYIEALKKVIEQGKTGIVLVPEISLTPQTVSRFTANFPNQVAVLHSRMSPGERYDSWRRLKSGDFKIAIGPRSAIFAPLENIGLIVVDEEHESSYKQMDSQPLYNARDVAVYRGKLNQSVVILGSATPSLESYYNSKIQKYHLIELPQRIDDIPMPKVTIVDMLTQRKRYPGKKVAIFSKVLQDKIIEKLSLNQQIILLQNRRGFSTYIKCKACGFIEQCENCNITLTYHLTTRTLRCHYCNYTKRAPQACPKCGSIDILFQGTGTQKVEQEINQIFSEARVVRMDLDTTSRKFAHDRILGDFGSGKYNILLGTQMVAKGLDFQNVTLVGVISADTSLLFPDFRASERTFQLLTQVAGRAGRKNLTGEVYIQTYSPDNMSLKFAQQHNFKQFFFSELPIRKELDYPPFGRLVYILLKGEDEQKVAAAAEVFHHCLEIPENLGKILGPIAAPLSKIKKNFRWQLIIKSDKKIDPSGNILRKYLVKALTTYKSQKQLRGVKILIDIDPISLL